MQPKEDVTWLISPPLLSVYFKCRAGHYTLPIADYAEPKVKALVSLAIALIVLIPKCHTKLFQFSYFNRIAKLMEYVTCIHTYSYFF